MKILSYKDEVGFAEANTLTAMKILSNANRYAIMNLLLNARGDLCVHELSEIIGISQSATSHYLAHLEACGVVQGTRTGKTKCYLPTKSLLTKKIVRIIRSSQ